MVALFQYKCAKGRRFLIGCYPTASIFFANVYTQEKEAGATFAWDVHDWLRGEKLLREVIGGVSTNCYLLKHNIKVGPFPEVYAGDGGQLGRASSLGSSIGEGTSLLVFVTPREHAQRPGYGRFPFIKKCHFPCHWLSSPSNTQWNKIYSCIRNLSWTKQ